MDISIRPRFEYAVSIFNKGEFYICHDLLEDIWYEVRDDSRNFYQGLVHLAVGLYHLTVKKNPKGALLQLEKCIKKLSPYKPEFEGVETAKLVENVKDIISGIKKDINYELKSPPQIKFLTA